MKQEIKELFEEKQYELLLAIKKYLHNLNVDIDQLFLQLGQGDWGGSASGFCSKSNTIMNLEEVGMNKDQVYDFLDYIYEYQESFVELFKNHGEICPVQIYIVFDMNNEEIHKKYINKVSSLSDYEIYENWKKKVSNNNEDLIPDILSSDSGIYLQGIEIEYDSNIKSSAKHIQNDIKVLENNGFDNLILQHLIPWLLNEQFVDKDPHKVMEGLHIYNILYHYGKIGQKASPTGKAAFYGQFSFQIESSDVYTKDILDAVEMNILIRNGKIVEIRNYDI